MSKPNPPTNFSIRNSEYTQRSLFYSFTNNSPSNTIGYTIYYSSYSNFSTASVLVNLSMPPNTQNISYNDTQNKLSYGSVYYFVMAVYNASQTSNSSNVVGPLKITSVPTAPTNLNITLNDNITKKLNYSFIASTSGNVTNNYLLYSTSSNMSSANLIAMGFSTSGGTTRTGTIIINELVYGVAYYFSLQAYNEYGDSESSSTVGPLTIMSQPNAPTNFNISINDSVTKKLDYSFIASTSGNVTNNYLLYSTFSNMSSANLIAIGNTATSGTITINELVYGVAYYFCLQAYNANGYSTNSSPVVSLTLYNIFTGFSGFLNNPTDNTTNYYGYTANSGFFSFTSSVSTFTNSGTILAAGGVITGPLDGSNGIFVKSTGNIANLYNYGNLLGGGGAGSNGRATGGVGGNGGAGGGGGGAAGYNTTESNTGDGGSLANANANGSNGREGSSDGPSSGQGGGGGGPGGSGGNGAKSNKDTGTNTDANNGNINISDTEPNWNGGNGGMGGYSLAANGSPLAGYNGGGGGYGGQDAVGGQGGGGGGGGGWGCDQGGNGGYSIYNAGGIIGNLYNSQGNNSISLTVTYGPLFYGGRLPNQYIIVINSSTLYGKLYYTGWGVTTTVTDMLFDISLAHNISSTLLPLTLTNVLVGNCFRPIYNKNINNAILSDGTFNLTWSIVLSTTLYLGNVTYNVFNLVIQKTSNFISGTGNIIASSLSLSGYIAQSDYTTSGTYITTISNSNTITSESLFANEMSINATYLIASGVGFTINSDKRIKKNIEPLSSTDSLQVVKALKPCQYNYVDFLKGTVSKYGYLAQEVEAVIPMVVNKNPAYIPNFFEMVKIENENPTKIVLDTKTTGSLAIGTNLQFYDIQNAMHIRRVQEIIDDKTFIIDEALFGTMFLYGQEVDDYRSIDTDQINTILLSALKECNGEIENQENDILELKMEIEEYITTR